MKVLLDELYDNGVANEPDAPNGKMTLLSSNQEIYAQPKAEDDGGCSSRQFSHESEESQLAWLNVMMCRGHKGSVPNTQRSGIDESRHKHAHCQSQKAH